jgi:hypothetical protein
VNKVLKTKLAKGNSNSLWQEVFDNIEDYVSKKEVESFASDTISDIRSTIKGKKSAYGWSAGKDSIVLDDLCRKAGMKKSVMAMTQLEFPAFVNWVLANKPEGCEIRITHHNLKWLAQHQSSMLGGKVPIVIVEHDNKEDDMVGTVTHNRARGTHLLEPMEKIVQTLLKEGYEVKDVAKKLGMKEEEVYRLSGFKREDFLKLMAGDKYSQARIYKGMY